MMKLTPCGKSSAKTVDELSREITNTIKEAAGKLGMIKTIQLGGPVREVKKPWIDIDCRRIKTKLNKASRDFRKLPSSKHRIRYAKIRSEYTKTIKEKRKDYITKLQKQLSEAKDMNQFWQLINNYRRKARKSCPISAEAWQQFYAKLFPPSLKIEASFQDVRHPSLDQDITYSELRDILINSPNKKTPGPDGVSAEFYKGLPDNWIYHLVRLFNKVLESGDIPQEWAQAEVVLIYKKGDEFDPLNYRGGALANAISKLLMTLLARRLSKWA